jgi:hypothetical protein
MRGIGATSWKGRRRLLRANAVILELRGIYDKCSEMGWYCGQMRANADKCGDLGIVRNL